MKWIWHWEGKNGIKHITANQGEAESALHNGTVTTVWAERVPEKGIKIIMSKESIGLARF